MTVLLTEKRQWERVSFFQKLIVLETSSGLKVDANSINISVGGIGFFSKKIFQKGTHLSIQICMNNELQAQTIWINAIVAWSKFEQDGAVTGAQFDTLIKAVNHPILYKIIYESPF